MIKSSCLFFQFTAITIFFINSAATTQEAVEYLQIIGYETSRHQKITNYESKKIFKGFLRYIKSSNLKLRTLFFHIDWNLLFTVSFVYLIDKKHGFRLT